MSSKSLSAGSIDTQGLHDWLAWLERQAGPMIVRLKDAILHWGSALHLEDFFTFLTKHTSLDQWMHSYVLPLVAAALFVLALFKRDRVMAAFIFVSAALAYIFYFLLPDMKLLQLSGTVLFGGALLTASAVGIYWLLIRSD